QDNSVITGALLENGVELCLAPRPPVILEHQARGRRAASRKGIEERLDDGPGVLPRKIRVGIEYIEEQIVSLRQAQLATSFLLADVRYRNRMGHDANRLTGRRRDRSGHEPARNENLMDHVDRDRPRGGEDRELPVPEG